MNISFKQRIMASILAAALIPVLIVAAITSYSSFENSRNVAEAGLEGIQESTKLRTQNYFDTVLKQVTEQAENPLVQSAIQDFSVAERNFDPAKVVVDNAKLKGRYVYQQEKTKGTNPSDVDGWMPREGAQIALQHLYISNNPNPIGEKQKLTDAHDGSAYSAVHSRYHPVFRSFVEQFGLYDFFLINKEGRVVYTDFKEIDFQSSVVDGPLANTAFSRVVKQALASKKRDETFMSDIETYMPSYNDGAIFVAAPILDEAGDSLGAVAFQLPTNIIGGVFTPLKKLGETVDGFIAGPDLTFRTPQTAESGKFGDKVNEQLGVVLKNVFDTGVGGVRAYSGADGFPMTGAFEIVQVGGVKWVIVVGQDDAEMLASTYKQLYMVLGVLMAVLVLVGVFGLWLSHVLSAPVIKLGHEFNGSTEKVSRSTGMVGDAVASMIAASEETSAQSTVVRKNSSEAAGYVGNVRSAVEELNTSIHDISQSIHETNVLVDDAVGKAKHTDDVVHKLGEASVRITEVVGLINDLAAQTNLLALNAAIEAARAGDAGRGFAVVADEVKKLASHTTQATVDIGAQIHEIKDVVSQSTVALKAVVDAIHRIRDNATAVSAAVEEQSGVAKQIASSVSDASNRVEQVDDNMNGIEQAANDTGIAADQVNIAVGEVQGALGDMKQQLRVTLKKMGITS